MPQTIRIPVWYRKFTNGKEFLETNAANVGVVITELHARFPDLKSQMLAGDGKLRRFVNVYVNEEDIRFLQNLQTPLKDGDKIDIVPPILD